MRGRPSPWEQFIKGSSPRTRWRKIVYLLRLMASPTLKAGNPFPNPTPPSATPPPSTICDLMSKWIEFHEHPRPAPIKTKLWYVVTKDRGSYLGEIRWHSPWRKYVFYPSETSLFEEDCLRDIAAFIEAR